MEEVVAGWEADGNSDQMAEVALVVVGRIATRTMLPVVVEEVVDVLVSIDPVRTLELSNLNHPIVFRWSRHGVEEASALYLDWYAQSYLLNIVAAQDLIHQL
jgi:hypothetical protein